MKTQGIKLTSLEDITGQKRLSGKEMMVREGLKHYFYSLFPPNPCQRLLKYHKKISNIIDKTGSPPGLRHNRIKNTKSKTKHIQMPCLVQTEPLFDEDRGLSLQE